MANPHILIVHRNAETARLLERAILRPAGYEVTFTSERKTAESLTQAASPALMIVGAELQDGNGLEFATELFKRYPLLPVILLTDTYDEKLVLQALRVGAVDYLYAPLRPDDVLKAVKRGIQRTKTFSDWSILEVRRHTKTLQKRVDSLETLQRIGRTVTALLDLDNVLTAVVDSAVELTGAEEGSLLLLDESTGELYMRASRNFQNDFAHKFRLPIQDTLAGQVLRTGKPLVIDAPTPQKIKTAYLVHTLIYVPLQVHGRLIGVLGVDNRQSGHPFHDEHLILVSALADYAAIAIENASLYSRSEIERKRFETILTNVDDGVLVIDLDDRLVLANHTLCAALGLGEEKINGKPMRDIIQHPDLIELLSEENRSQSTRGEVTLEDGRVFNAHLTPIPEVGYAVTMQDITHLKELDRIKSDFVSTVSHDLRSPLTAILGYIELIDRVGPLNDTQREFVRRVQFSVSNITALINDLLDLGRIEAGFDARKEIVPLAAIINYAVEGLRNRAVERQQTLHTEIPDNLPSVYANPVRLRQLVANLLGNAIKYTPNEGTISLVAEAEGGQVIIRVADNGPGIPPADQPYIFDKFYRASNVPGDTPGTGLGLAIVKSIVENHQGRIWVESNLGQGTVFTVVMPVSDHS
ncbi:MAG: ATP-binding protein [Chloroflexota bacterium]